MNESGWVENPDRIDRIFEGLAQRVLEHRLGQVACKADHDGPSCDVCGAVV